MGILHKLKKRYTCIAGSNLYDLYVMKKLFLLTCLSALAAAYSFCTNDYTAENKVSKITFKLDGVQKIFTTVTVKLESSLSESHPWQAITAQRNKSNEMVYFEIEKGYTGTDSFDGFTYSNNNAAYAMSWDAFSSSATINTDKKLEGTFSGTVKSWNTITQQNEIHIITNGSFTITK